jgi:hypothetical protein
MPPPDRRNCTVLVPLSSVSRKGSMLESLPVEQGPSRPTGRSS